MKTTIKRTPEEAKPFLKDLGSGKDEMNLVELPIFLLSTRAPKGLTSLRFCVDDYDAKSKHYIRRELNVIADAIHGLPTAAAEKVYLALMHHARAYNNFSDPLVLFCRHELLKTLRWPNKKESYDRLKLAMNQLAGVRLTCVNYWRDNKAKEYHRITENIGILDEFKFRDSRKKGETDYRAYLSEFRWGSTLFESFQSGYLKTLDLNVAMTLRPLALRLYRLLDKRFHAPKVTKLSYHLRPLAYERLGMSRNYNLGQVRRELKKAIAELTAVGFLESLDSKSLFPASEQGAKVAFQLGAVYRRGTSQRGTKYSSGLRRNRPEHRVVRSRSSNKKLVKVSEITPGLKLLREFNRNL